MNKYVAIVVLNYKNYSDTLECLQSLLEVEYPHIRIIVVDNDSKNGSLEQIASWVQARSLAFKVLSQEAAERNEIDTDKIILIQAKVNGGYAAGNNIGIRWAVRVGSEYIMVLNNDTVVNPSFIDPLVEMLDRSKAVGVVGPKVVYGDGKIDNNCARRRPGALDYIFRIGLIGALLKDNYWKRRHYYTAEYDFSVPKEVDIISGSCMLFRRSALEAVELFDENTFLYQEEFIMHERLRAKGLQTWVVPQSGILHKGGRSTQTEALKRISEAGIQSLRYYLRVYRRYPECIAGIVILNQRLLSFVAIVLQKIRKG